MAEQKQTRIEPEVKPPAGTPEGQPDESEQGFSSDGTLDQQAQDGSGGRLKPSDAGGKDVPYQSVPAKP